MFIGIIKYNFEIDTPTHLLATYTVTQLTRTQLDTQAPLLLDMELLYHLALKQSETYQTYSFSAGTFLPCCYQCTSPIFQLCLGSIILHFHNSYHSQFNFSINLSWRIHSKKTSTKNPVTWWKFAYPLMKLEISKYQLVNPIKTCLYLPSPFQTLPDQQTKLPS